MDSRVLRDTLPPHFEQSILAIVLPSHVCKDTAKNEVSYCGWYSKWIYTKFTHLPKEILHCMQNVSLVFEEVAVGARKQQSLDAITQTLLDRQLIISNDNVDRQCMARMAAFTFLGWQSMLYEADIKPSDGAIAIADTLDGYRSSTFFRLCPSCPQTGRSLAELLLSFGLMLPKADICTSEETEDLEAFENVKVVTPGGLNAAALSSLGHFNFKFVDTIAPHLELDKATNTIFLYRWPSFCLANICASKENEPDSILHSLASQTHPQGLWACPREVTHLLEEIVLSFRLLFGQDQRSRKLFKRHLMKAEILPWGMDDMLVQLCTKAEGSPQYISHDKECYRLARDFPVLRQRIAVLQHQLTHVKPRGWRAIWRDRRDSAQWYTFWAVIVFGSVGTLLAMIQTVMQGIQTFRPDKVLH